MGDVHRFPGRARGRPADADNRLIAEIDRMAREHLQLGGLIDLPPSLRRKQLVADGRRWVWRPVPTPVAIHQLPGFRPFHGVSWMPGPRQQRAARLRRARASEGWLREIFARG